jgi:hypothetical protein
LMMTPVEASEGLTTEDGDGGFGMFLTILVIAVHGSTRGKSSR